jgi:hypothetical protein
MLAPASQAAASCSASGTEIDDEGIIGDQAQVRERTTVASGQ